MTSDVMEPKNQSFAARRMYMLAVAVAITGFIVTLWAWRASHLQERQKIEKAFRAECENLQRSVKWEFDLFTDVLDSIGQLHTLSDRISREDLEEFVNKGMLHQRRILHAYGFAQRVPREARDAMEQSPSDTNDAPFMILEPDGKGGYVRAGDREDYYPLIYQTPPDALGLPLGYDFYTYMPDAQAIARMSISGRVTLGGAVENPGRPDLTGFHVFAPILYRPVGGEDEQNSLYLYGFSIATLWPEELLQRAMARTSTRHVRVSLFAPGQTRPDEPQDSVQAGLVYDEPLSLMDEAWTFRCVAQPEYTSAHGTRQPSLILYSGLAITILLTLQLLFLAGRTAEVERTVQQRTAALSEANRRLEQEMAERMRLEGELLEFSSREQQRIGRDLHDSLGQKLAGAVFLSRAIATHLEETGSPEAENAGKMNATLKEAVSQVRRIARGLSPVDLGEEGLAHALRRLADEVCDVFNVSCSFRSNGDMRIHDAKMASHLYQIAQEAVSNAVRHGQPREITIHLLTTPEGGRLVIEDDGTGLPADADQRGGMGLRLMRYRATMINGALDVKPRDGGGTVLTCRFNLAGPNST